MAVSIKSNPLNAPKLTSTKAMTGLNLLIIANPSPTEDASATTLNLVYARAAINPDLIRL